MSNAIVQSLNGNLQFTFSLVDKFLESCPDDIWKAKFGGWPVWQQIYHAFTSVDFFLRPPEAPMEATPCDPDANSLKSSPAQAPDTGDLRDFIVKAQARVALYASTLDDDALALKNDGPSARMGREMSHAAVLSLINAHIMYHLGACDAALRERGLPGVF
jgi:hypothetical protein